MERAAQTCGKYKTHRLSVLTWAVWKGTLPQLLPMSDYLVRAFVWDALAFETTLPVLKHCLGAIKAWLRRGISCCSCAYPWTRRGTSGASRTA